MPARRVSLALILPIAAIVQLLSACSASPRQASAAPPRAEFLLSSVDSTFWISTTTGQMRVRGAPLVLAHYDGRYYELYAADDDHSFEDALLLGERVYRRDLLTGDSAVVFADTTVPRLAQAYARAHPDETPLGPDDEGSANPGTSATAEVDILDVTGPYLSYEYHVDVGLPGRRPWHTTRRGVVDLRSGKDMSVADLFGSSTGTRLVAAGRKAYETTRDSIVRVRGSLSDEDRRAATALSGLQFDERSFTLAGVDGHAGVAFGVPGHGEGAAGNVVELAPLGIDSVSWWAAAAAGAAHSNDSGDDSWTGTGYRVLARYDTSGEIARLSLADSSRREWPVATVAAPLRRIDWLDKPAASAAERQALLHAFNQASTYDENARVAARRDAPNLSLVNRHAPIQVRPRKPSRNVRAHDARALQQHGPRVRRGRVVDARQDRGHRGLSPLPQLGGHRVD